MTEKLNIAILAMYSVFCWRVYDEWEQNTSLRGPSCMYLRYQTHLATFSNLDCFLIKQDLDLISQMDNSTTTSTGRFVDVYMNSNSSEAGNGIFWLWRTVPCLLMHCFIKSPLHQQARHGIGCVGHIIRIVVPELISSTWFKSNPRQYSKYEYIFYNVENNSVY